MVGNHDNHPLLKFKCSALFCRPARPYDDAVICLVYSLVKEAFQARDRVEEARLVFEFIAQAESAAKTSTEIIAIKIKEDVAKDAALHDTLLLVSCINE